jgi:ABC-type Na+ efflux pump permease subunit
MRIGRALPAVALLLMALWSVGFTAAVLGEKQIPLDMAAGAVIAAVLLPAFSAACVLGLLVWPLVRAMEDDSSEAAGEGPLPSEP